MKRKIAWIVSLMVLFTLALPLQGYAESFDKGLQKAIVAAKQLFTIPEDYKFEPTVSSENGKKMFALSWRSKDESGRSIYIRMDENARLLGYSKYNPDDYQQPQRKLPKYSRQDARALADKFIARVSPTLTGKIRFEENNNASSLTDPFYYINYYRLENNLPFYNNGVTVTVNRNTGEVQSYNLNWTDGVTFPAPKGAKTLAQAQKAYIDNLGIQMIYKYSQEDDKVKLYAVFTPRYSPFTYVVDAFTGEKVKLEGSYYGPYYDGMYSRAEMKERASMDQAAGVSLSPEEQKAVEDAGKLISQEKAEELARKLEYLDLKDYKLTSPYLTKAWPLNDKYVYQLGFTREATDTVTYSYASVTLDAQTGEIRGFYADNNYSEKDKGTVSADDAKKAAEDFLKAFKPAYFAQIEYVETQNNDFSLTNEPLARYYFTFTRKVNGALFPENFLSVTYDAVNKKIAAFDMMWFDGVDFPALDKAISPDAAYKVLFDKIGLELQYSAKYPQADPAKPYIEMQRGTPEIKLVYTLKRGKPLFLDAMNGTLLEYDGKPYKEVKTAQYTDIANSPAKKEIMVLAEYGISLDGTKFNPKAQITQLDFLTLLSKTLNVYYGPVILANSPQKDIDNLYSVLIREGILKQNEKNQKGIVTNEDAVKFIIRALKYDKVADIQGIYNCPFKDRNKISKGLVGYVTIADGLNIITGTRGYFNPKGKLTRENAARMIYNYLQV